MFTSTKFINTVIPNNSIDFCTEKENTCSLYPLIMAWCLVWFTSMPLLWYLLFLIWRWYVTCLSSNKGLLPESCIVHYQHTHESLPLSYERTSSSPTDGSTADSSQGSRSSSLASTPEELHARGTVWTDSTAESREPSWLCSGKPNNLLFEWQNYCCVK